MRLFEKNGQSYYIVARSLPHKETHLLDYMKVIAKMDQMPNFPIHYTIREIQKIC